MELLELMSSISSKSPKHYMIWFGEEQKIIDLYLEQLENLGYKKTLATSVKSVLSSIHKKSLDKSAKLFVVNEDEEFQKMENKWDFICEDFVKSKHIIVLRYAKLNKKLKFFTRNKQNCVEFLHLQPEILTSYIRKDIELSDKSCEKLIEMCDKDYGRILLEIDKVKQYVSVNNIPADDAFCILCKEGAIYSTIGDITFELTNAVLGGYTEIAIQKLDEAKRKGEPSIMIASILYTGFRNLLAWKGLGRDKKGAKERTGMSGWQIKQCIDLDGGYSIKETERNMLICQNVESGIKMGKIDDDIALDYLVLSCLV